MRSAARVQAEARAHRLSIFCASCDRYWDARDRGVPGTACASAATDPRCGSPLAGGEFHDYRGPITDFGRWCFVCGLPATQGIQAAGTRRVFGICDGHLPFVLRLKPEGAAAPLLVVRTPELVPVEALIRPPQPSALVRAMRATQEEWDHLDAKRGRG